MAEAVRWPWTKHTPAPEIPPYQPPPIDIRPPEPKDPSIIVDEVDTTDMSATGIHRAWRKLTGGGE